MRAQIMNLLVQLLFLTFQYFKERRRQKPSGMQMPVNQNYN
jgi:hypothetical protein